MRTTAAKCQQAGLQLTDTNVEELADIAPAGLAVFTKSTGIRDKAALDPHED